MNTKPDIPIPAISGPERRWLEEIYPRNLSGQRFTVRDIWSKLHGELPPTFRPENMHPRLVTAGGLRIQLSGILVLENCLAILGKVDKVVWYIKDLLLRDPTRVSVATKDISENTGLDNALVSFILQAAREYGNYFRTCTMEQGTTVYTMIDFGGDDAVYYEYLTYPGIEILMKSKSYEKYRRPIEPFTPAEMVSMNQKLDSLVADMEKLKAGQEVIWTDVRCDISAIRGEMEEMKDLYSLGKHHWRQLMVGKITEMIAAGIIADTVSKQVEDLFNAGVHQLVRH
jgi:hypothetical protein